MNNIAKANWTFKNCELQKGKASLNNTTKKNKPPVSENSATAIDKTLNALVDSDNFMNDQFDSFGYQLKLLISSINELKIENEKN